MHELSSLALQPLLTLHEDTAKCAARRTDSALEIVLCAGTGHKQNKLLFIKKNLQEI